MRKIYLVLLAVCFAAMANAQVTVTGDGAGGSPYATLDLAIQAVNGVGTLTQPTTITTTISETALAGGYQITAIGSAVNTLIISGGGNTYTAFGGQTVGNLYDAVFKLIGADYVTIQNFVIAENPANIITGAGTNDMTEWGIALLYASTTNGSQNNTIQNNTISLNRTYQNTFGIYSNTRHSAIAPTTSAEVTAASGSNSFNKVYSNTISNVNYGIVFIGAGTTIAAIDNGNDIGGASAATGNTLTNWGGIGVATSSYTSLTALNCGINLNQQIGDNISYNSITSFANGATGTITMAGIFKAYSVAPPTAATFTSNINNNTVTVSAAPAAGAGGVSGILSSNLTATATATININNNTVTNCAISGITATTGNLIGIQNSSAPGILNMNGNTVNGLIRNAGTTGQIQGILNLGAVVTTLNINNNFLGTAALGFASYTTYAGGTGTLFGYGSTTGASTCNTSIQNNDIRGISYAIDGTNAHQYISASGTPLTNNVSNNTFTNLTARTSGAITFIAQGYTVPTGGSQTFNNNSIVTGFAKTVANGNVVITTTNSTSGNGTTANYTNNNFSNISVLGTSTITGFNNTDGGTGTTKTITGNTFNNWTSAAGLILAMNFTYWNGVSTLSSNTITNLTGQAAVTAISMGAVSNAATSVTVTNNTINNLSSTGVGGAVTGIVCNNTSLGIVISNHNIHTLSSTGASTVSGITISGSNAAGTNVFKNNIYNLSNSNATPTVSGITISGGALTNAYNNFVSDLRAPNANAAVPIYGINNSGGTNAGIYYNTIALGNNATLTSAGAQFGVTGIGYSSTTNATLRNNIVWIDATPVGTGTVSAVRKSAAGVANTAPTAANFNSNANIYHVVLAAGAPPVAANINKYLYLEGTITTTATNGYGIDIGQADVIAQNLRSDINFNTACGIYKTFMGAREGGTFNENNLTASGAPAFTFVPTGASYASNSGLVIATPNITDDYNSVARTATPDMGALEFTGTSIDATPPSIVYTALLNTICTSAPTLAVTISDASGVNVTPGLAPRLYYRKGGAVAEADAFGTYPGDNTSAFNGWKYVEATGTAPNFSFAINYSLLQTAMAVGDSLTYFVMAQDNNGVTNVGKNVVTFSGIFCPTSVDLSGVTSTTSGTNGYTIIGIPTTQPLITAVTAGSINQQVLRIDIPANQCGTLTQLDFTELSTASADISRARVYYTTTTTFATTTQFGADVISPAGSYVVTGSQALSTTLPNYFWLVYDISCAAPATAGNTADASVTAATVSSVITVPAPNQNPTGTRTINSLALSFLSNQPSILSVQQGAISQQVLRLDIPATSCGTITNIDFANLSTNVADVTNARVYYTTTTTFSTATLFGSIAAPGATFSVTGSVTPSSTLTNYFWLVYDIDCAATIANTVDASATSITIGGTPQAVPAGIQNPAGTRAIIAAIVGDNITDAPTAVFGLAATNAYTVSGKTIEVGEPSPILNTQGGGGSGRSNYSWGTVANGTTWYKLIVPTTGYGSSGNLAIWADTSIGSPSDNQVAVWEFPSMPSGCGLVPNYAGARLLAANDDRIVGNDFIATGETVFSSLNAVVRTRLTPGNTYYVQIDGFSAALPFGNLYIEDLASAPHNLANNGLGNYHNPTGVDMRFGAYEVNGTDGWTYYYENNGTPLTLTDDKVLMATKLSSDPNFYYAGTYLPGTVMSNHLKRSAQSLTAPSTGNALIGADSIVVWSGRNNAAAASADLKPTAPYVVPSTPAWWMMNKYWNLIPKNQPSVPIGVRYFYSDADYTAVNLAAGNIMTMHSDLRFLKFTKSLTTHYSNNEVDPALGQATITSGTAYYLTWVNIDGVEAGADPINQAQFDVVSFSGGGGGAATVNPLPVNLLSFSGYKDGSRNQLRWITASESNNSGFEMQRSSDGVNYTALGFVNTQALGGNSTSQLNYAYTDNNVTGNKQYYRLRQVNFDGNSKLSNIVLIKGDKPVSLTIDGLFPNPASSLVNVLIAAPAKDNVTLIVTDIAGRKVIEQVVSVETGSNTIPVDINRLTNGTYLVKLVCSSNCDGVVGKFVKQ